MSLNALLNQRLLQHHADPADWLEWDGWLRAMGHFELSSAESAVFDSYPLLLQAAVAGHGIALGWRRTTQRLIWPSKSAIGEGVFSTGLVLQASLFGFKLSSKYTLLLERSVQLIAFCIQYILLNAIEAWLRLPHAIGV